jgi:RNA polymerase sigma-70 factor (ECF subfamily)
VTLTPTEIDLFNKCQKGERKAQLLIYDQYASGMYNVALRIVKDTAQAEDMMQDSMITAFAKMSQWNREASFGSWLKRIVINNCLSYLKKEKRMPKIAFDDVAYEIEQLEDVQSYMETAGMTAKKVIAVMEGLKDNYKQILTLHLIEGMDNEEICEIMNISNAMCRTTLSRAKECLRNKMQLK